MEKERSMNLNKINDNFKIVTIDSDKDVVWTMVDRFGNIVTPFFADGQMVVERSLENCLVLGRQQKEKTKKLYSVSSSYDDIDDYSCKRVRFPYEVKYIAPVNKNTILFLTSQGLCFVDSASLEQKSDFYDALYYSSDPKVKSWVYEKEVEGDKLKTTLTGTISFDGHVGPLAYDVLLRKIKEVGVSRVGRLQYDVIDTTETLNDLRDKEYENSRRRITNIRRLQKNIANK